MMHLVSSLLLLPLVASAAVRSGAYTNNHHSEPLNAATETATTDSFATATPSVDLGYCTVAAAAGNSTVGFWKYQNIRFAKAPTGDLRWAPPAWPDIESAVNNGSLADSDVDCSSTEDCLFLDVWAPANVKGKKLPVMVWTYGGGFTGGSKSQNTPEGLFDLSTDFIFVAYNYRLGMTGLANGPTFLHEGGTSNTAIWDVQHAFEWVRKYIGHFGGDPELVTAVGFSAGGSQTLFQFTRFAGRAEQLFKQAYVMSPGFVPGAGHQHAEAFWQNVSSAVGCDGGHLSCMRDVDFATLIEAGDNISSEYNYQFQPRVDGDIVADTYEAQFYQKRFNFKGPVVLTHEQHEANGQAYNGVNTTKDISTYLKIFFPAIEDTVVQEILDLYPEDDYESPGLRFSDMKQHFDLTAHNLAATQALGNNTWNAMVALDQASHGTDQSYYWYSTYSLSSSTTSDNASSGNSSSTEGPGGSGMGGGPGGGGMGGGSVNATTAVIMQKYLLSFVLTGNPNTKWADDKTYWPKYNEGDGATELVFNTTMYTQTDDLLNDKALFWNQARWY